MKIRRLQLALFVHKIFLGRVAATMEDIAIDATAVIGNVGGIAVNVAPETTTPTDGAQVAQVLQITIGAKVVPTKLTATVAIALVTHVETLVVNVLATTTMATITATTVHTATLLPVLPAVVITQAVQAVPVQQRMSIVTPATVQIPRANVTVLNAATTIRGGVTMEEAITMGGEVRIQLMDATVTI